jgi:formyl-CoA transferase
MKRGSVVGACVGKALYWNKKMAGPLQGVRVVDLSTVLMVPFATQILGEMGADVIKVETLQGDLVRQIGPSRNPGMGPVYLNANRCKRSISLDLKTQEGRDILLRLIQDADVFTYNVRPQAIARLKLTYEDLFKINPKIIYVGVFGYGQDGPYAARPAYDDLIQGAVGLAALAAQASGGEPRYVPCAIADRITGLTAVNAISSALFHRERTGEGQKIDVPMFETMAAFVLNDHLGGMSYVPTHGESSYARLLSRDRKPYKTKDGYVCTMIYNDNHWRSFLRAVDKEHLMETDERFSSFASRSHHINSILSEVSEIFRTKTTADWIQILESVDVPVTPMHDLETIFEDPHLMASSFFSVEDHPTEGRIRKMRVPTKWSRTQPVSSRHAPKLGEHTVEILNELGFTELSISAMISRKIVHSPNHNERDLPEAENSNAHAG